MGSSDLNLMAAQGAGGLMENKATVYWMLGVSSLGTFLLPALLLQQVEKKQGLRYWRVAPLGMGKYLFVAIVVSFGLQPFDGTHQRLEPGHETAGGVAERRAVDAPARGSNGIIDGTVGDGHEYRVAFGESFGDGGYSCDR